MSNIAICVEDLSKLYYIGLKEQIHDTMGGALLAWLKKPVSNFRNLRKLSTSDQSESAEGLIWALRDVSFEVKHGEVLGIIGRNGAGKSTLLKILSRITEPTSGRALLNGRVGSLLEVGTGFHPELTGRENVYMNGTILGMKKKEIDAKFDEIVDFSGVEQFLDTPIKRYSSGMRVRLAFAVAAHLEPELLVVDEVLAVGDMEFQKKCLGKMQDVAQVGRTVLFVSHNMGAVQNLCPRTLSLASGRVVEDGTTDAVVRNYLGAMNLGGSSGFSTANPDRKITGDIILTGGRLLDQHLQDTMTFIAGTPLILEFSYSNPCHHRTFEFWATIVNEYGVEVFKLTPEFTGFRIEASAEGLLRCRIPKLPLTAGQYHIITAVLVEGKNSDVITSALTFGVSTSVFHTHGPFQKSKDACALVQQDWEAVPSLS